MVEKRVREKQLEDLVPAELLESAGIDPLNPLASFRYRSGSFCHLFGSTTNSENVLCIVQCLSNRVGTKISRSSRWYWKISDDATVRNFLGFAGVPYETNPFAVQFVDSSKRIAGSALAELVENYLLSPSPAEIFQPGCS